MTGCELHIRRLSAHLDNELPANERAEVDAHLSTCAPCRTRLAQLGEADRAFSAVPEPEWRADSTDALVGKLKAQLAREAPATPPAHVIAAAQGWGPWRSLAFGVAGILALAVFPAAFSLTGSRSKSADEQRLAHAPAAKAADPESVRAGAKANESRAAEVARADERTGNEAESAPGGGGYAAASARPAEPAPAVDGYAAAPARPAAPAARGVSQPAEVDRAAQIAAAKPPAADPSLQTAPSSQTAANRPVQTAQSGATTGAEAPVGKAQASQLADARPYPKDARAGGGAAPRPAAEAPAGALAEARSEPSASSPMTVAAARTGPPAAEPILEAARAGKSGADAGGDPLRADLAAVEARIQAVEAAVARFTVAAREQAVQSSQLVSTRRYVPWR